MSTLELLHAIETGDPEDAIRLAAADLALKSVDLPHGMNAWHASRVPRDGNPEYHALRALDARSLDFGGYRTPVGERYDRNGELRRRQAAASRAASEVGHFDVKDDNPNGSIAWRSPDGDLSAVPLNTIRPHTERTAQAIAALEEAGYQNGADSEPAVQVPNPFHATNPHQNAEVFRAQE